MLVKKLVIIIDQKPKSDIKMCTVYSGLVDDNIIC